MKLQAVILLFLFAFITGITHSFSQNDTINAKRLVADAEELIKKSPEECLNKININIKKIDKQDSILFLQLIFLKAQAFYKLKQIDSSEKYFQYIVEKNPENLKNHIKEVKVYNYLGLIQSDKGKYSKSVNYYKTSIEKSKKYNLKYREAAGLNNLALIYDELGFYDKSYSALSKSLNIFQKLNDTIAIIRTFNNLGLLNKELKDYKTSEQYFLKSLALSNKIHYDEMIASGYLNLAYSYIDQKKYKKALEFLIKSEKILKLSDNIEKKTELYDVLGDLYLKLNEYDKSLQCYQKAYNLIKDKGALNLKIKTLNKSALFYLKINDLKQAYKYIKKTDELLMNNDEISLKKDYYQIKSLYYEKKKDYAEALKFHKKYSEINDNLNKTKFNNKVAKLKVFYNSETKQKKIDELKNKEEINDIINKKQKEKIKIITYIIILGFVVLLLTVIFIIYILRLLKAKNRLFFSIKKNRKLLLEKNQEIIQQNEEIKSQTEQLYEINEDLMQLKTAIDATDNAVVILDKNGNFEWANKGFDRLYDISFEEFVKKYPNILDASENSSNYVEMSRVIKNTIKNKTSGSYEFSTLNNNGEKIWIKTNIKAVTDLKGDIQSIIVIDTDITDKVKTGRLLEIKNHELEKQKEEINSSLRYAKTIQNAILPVMSGILKNDDFFLIYLPRDIVSGDFYWLLKKENSPYTFCAVVDCTGHGVPGAFMSMIGARLLNHIVTEKNIHLPSEILEQLNISVRIALKQKLSGNKDGMDISLVRFEKTHDDKTEIVFSGAKQSIFLYRHKKETLEKFRGDVKSIGGFFEDNVPFTDKKIIAEKGDIIYLYSDGIIDQNSPVGKKIGTPGFQKILETVSSYPMKNQKEMILKILNEHKKNSSQRDDITIIGIKID